MSHYHILNPLVGEKFHNNKESSFGSLYGCGSVLTLVKENNKTGHDRQPPKPVQVTEAQHKQG